MQNPTSTLCFQITHCMVKKTCLYFNTKSLTLWSWSEDGTSFPWASYGYLWCFLQWQRRQTCDMNATINLMQALSFRADAFMDVLPCHELLLGRPFSQTSEMCLASGILSLQEWDRPLDLQTKEERNSLLNSLNAVTEIKRVLYEENKWLRRHMGHSYLAVHFNVSMVYVLIYWITLNSLLWMIELILVSFLLSQYHN